MLRRYFETAPDPDRGVGLAAVTGELSFAAAKPGLIRDLAAARTDPELFAWSYDYVGDLAETVALMWPTTAANAAPPRLHEVGDTHNHAPKAELPAIVAAWLDASDPTVRFALLKLITGGLRVGVSARLAKVALAELSAGRIAPDDIEEVWHGLAPPYQSLFAWIEGHAPRPDPAEAPVFRPPMLAHPLERSDSIATALDPAAFARRMEMGRHPGATRLHPRRQADLFARRRRHFRGLPGNPRGHAVRGRALTASFWSSGTAWSRHSPTCSSGSTEKPSARKCCRIFPAARAPVATTILFDGAEDVRALLFDARRARLEA